MRHKKLSASGTSDEQKGKRRRCGRRDAEGDKNATLESGLRAHLPCVKKLLPGARVLIVTWWDLAWSLVPGDAAVTGWSAAWSPGPHGHVVEIRLVPEF